MVTIIMNKSLHQPMYCLLFNLPINDLIGSSALFPQLIKEILLDTRHIEVSNCITQAFFIHIYAVGSVLILAAMAYDRSLMPHSYCDNPSLLSLVCHNTTINNIYGLFITAGIQIFGLVYRADQEHW
ncbi:hypothetical protein AAFF_G00336060 [Aldrovandia affinis]|uniref:G-protein coupled receptors family 1 profile domain-containing protein n=1 Tax=Aldrovandia affinis TaxID=143900 RepID=A0AAD7WPZ9_9TELE|nr:hypothetical protein AAFF_G00336060 [Aldrovandia affinis]